MSAVNGCPIQTLPTDLSREVATYCSIPTFFNFIATCQQFYQDKELSAAYVLRRRCTIANPNALLTFNLHQSFLFPIRNGVHTSQIIKHPDLDVFCKNLRWKDGLLYFLKDGIIFRLDPATQTNTPFIQYGNLKILAFTFHGDDMYFAGSIKNTNHVTIKKYSNLQHSRIYELGNIEPSITSIENMQVKDGNLFFIYETDDEKRLGQINLDKNEFTPLEKHSHEFCLSENDLFSLNYSQDNLLSTAIAKRTLPNLSTEFLYEDATEHIIATDNEIFYSKVCGKIYSYNFKTQKIIPIYREPSCDIDAIQLMGKKLFWTETDIQSTVQSIKLYDPDNKQKYEVFKTADLLELSHFPASPCQLQFFTYADAENYGLMSIHIRDYGASDKDFLLEIRDGLCSEDKKIATAAAKRLLQIPDYMRQGVLNKYFQVCESGLDADGNKLNDYQKKAYAIDLYIQEQFGSSRSNAQKELSGNK